MMKRALFPLIGIVAAFFVMTLGATDNIARGQSAPPPPTSVTAVNGANPGEVRISWQAASGSAPYRIGWMANEDYEAAGGATGPHWVEQFRYSNIGNRGQTTHTVTRLTPGIHYWFIVGSNDNRYDDLGWSQWAGLALTSDPGGTTCPACPVCPAVSEGICPISPSVFKSSTVEFQAVDAGKNHTCGIKMDNTIECWGDNTHGQSNAPDGQFLSVSAGGVYFLRDQLR